MPAAKDTNVMIPYPIAKCLAELLEDQCGDSHLWGDIYLYLHGKVVQADLREKYNPNDKKSITLYNNNKKVIEEIEERIKISLLNT